MLTSPFNTMKTGPEGSWGGGGAAIRILSLCPSVPKGTENTCRAYGDGMAWWPGSLAAWWPQTLPICSLALPGMEASLAHRVALRTGWASCRAIQKGTGVTEPQHALLVSDGEGSQETSFGEGAGRTSSHLHLPELMTVFLSASFGAKFGLLIP